MKRLIRVWFSNLKNTIRIYFLNKKKIKYELTDSDNKFIKMMEDEYEMKPTFYDNGLYSFDMKIEPSFNNAQIKKIEEL